jgi:hypothetical protein
MRVALGQLLAALAGFLRGFTGLEAIGSDPAAARRALEERAARRPTCC